MQNIFTLQSQITSQIQSYLAEQETYAAYTFNWQQGEELGLEQLPAIMTFILTSVPTDGEREQNQDGSHNQTMHLAFRMVLPTPYSVTLEALADSILNDVTTCVATSCRGLVRQVGNPTLNYKYADTSQLRTADVEIPIIFMTSAS